MKKQYPWDKLSPSTQRKLAWQGDPRVPADYKRNTTRGRPRKLVPVMADGRSLTAAARAARRIDTAIQLLLTTYKTKEGAIAAIAAYEEFVEV